MTNKTLNSRHAIDSFTYQLHSWKPFQLQNLTRTLDSSDLCNNNNPKSYNSSPSTPPPPNVTQNKRTCLCDRSFSVDTVDMSKLNLLEEERTTASTATPHKQREKFRWIARKRRRGSRSVSGRSSDRSGTRRCSVGASAAYATCSDFPVAAGTDSSGELFVNGDANWSSDVSEVKNSRKEGKDSGGSGEKENLGFGSWQFGGVDAQGNESGYGSEPGYRGDAELGYGDEFDEEEDDGRVLFWGERIGDADCDMEIVGDNTFSEQKSHHRCRRKKHDCRIDAMSR
ncbi:Lyr motif protein [Thalictrum thalictroides]|uniref:Lyr motif protein n=1 Tax=Thalictrum thalictroides TaxID=46969 RepID=A0A7J6W1T0_THATH|nr:Lyr motif protein [Thalictrum thalictroides]